MKKQNIKQTNIWHKKSKIKKKINTNKKMNTENLKK